MYLRPERWHVDGIADMRITGVGNCEPPYALLYQRGAIPMPDYRTCVRGEGGAILRSFSFSAAD
jgi:hypothetical protein